MSGRMGELLLITIIILIVFGAGRLPQVMKELGRGLRSFRDGLSSGSAGDSRDGEARGHDGSVRSVPDEAAKAGATFITHSRDTGRESGSSDGEK